MANKEKTFIEENEAANYTLHFADVERETNWSRAKIFRAIDSGKLNPVYLRTAKNKPLFDSNEVLKASGAIQAEPVQTDLETMETPKQTAIEKQQTKAVTSKSQKNLTSEKNKSQNLNADFETIFLLPHKKILTLKEAQKISGLPAEVLKVKGIKTPSGYKFTDKQIQYAVENYMKYYEKNPHEHKPIVKKSEAK